MGRPGTRRRVHQPLRRNRPCASYRLLLLILVRESKGGFHVAQKTETRMCLTHWQVALVCHRATHRYRAQYCRCTHIRTFPLVQKQSLHFCCWLYTALTALRVLLSINALYQGHIFWCWRDGDGECAANLRETGCYRNRRRPWTKVNPERRLVRWNQLDCLNLVSIVFNVCVVCACVFAWCVCVWCVCVCVVCVAWVWLGTTVTLYIYSE